MKRQLIEDFLNLPGIEGIALMDGQSRSYSYGLPKSCDYERQQCFTQGVQQIIETTPISLESFNFNFEGHQVFLYKIDRGMTLLVMTEAALESGDTSADYARSIAQITRFMRTDFDAVAKGLLAVVSPVVALEEGQPMGVQETAADSALEATEVGLADVSSQPPAAVLTTSVDEVLTAMNQLSDFTTQYLGKFIVANHWRTHRPDEIWLSSFQITSHGLVILSKGGKLNPSDLVAPQELGWIRDWVMGFSRRCAKIIRDYPVLVQEQALDARQWQLLFDSD